METWNMKDMIPSEIKDGKCPDCGKKKVISKVQYPLVVEMDMDAKPVFRGTDGKKKRTGTKDMANAFEDAISGKYQCADYYCEACGWRYKVKGNQRMTIKELRKTLGMTQEEFTDYIGLPFFTLRNWDQGKKIPEGIERLIERVVRLENPEIFKDK